MTTHQTTTRLFMMMSSALVLSAGALGCATDAPGPGGAGGTVDGKADGAGLAGAYYAFEGSGEVDALQVLAIHPPTSSRRGVTLGEFDLTRDLGDYESSLTRGKYRSYAVDGVPHLRLTGSDGEVVFDAPWQLDGRELVLDPEGDAPATLRHLSGSADEQLSCVTTQVLDPTVFEEGLSVYEYPFVAVAGADDPLALSIGSHGFAVEDAALEVVDDGGALTATATLAEDGSQRIVRVDAGPVRRGTVEVAEADGEPVVVAHVTCY